MPPRLDFLESCYPSALHHQDRQSSSNWPPRRPSCGSDRWVRTTDFRLMRAALWPTELCRHVAPLTGFEPVIFRLEGGGPSPLDDRGFVGLRG